MKNKKKLKKLGHLLVKGAKGSAKAVKKYGPVVHHHVRAISESTMDAMMPSRTRTHIDMTARRKPRKVYKTKQGFYLDYTL